MEQIYIQTITGYDLAYYSTSSGYTEATVTTSTYPELTTFTFL